MSDRETMLAYCALRPDDAIAMSALADAVEANGEDALADALHWCVRRGRRPRRTAVGQWAWGRAVLGCEPAAADELPYGVLLRMTGTPARSTHFCRTYEDAFAALAEALEALRADVA